VTPDRFKPLLDSEFLKAELDYEFKDFVASGEDGGFETARDTHPTACA